MSQFILQEPNTTLSVYVSGTAGTIRVGDVPGSLAVYFSPSIPTVVSNAGVGTFGVNIGKIDGTIQVDVGRIIDSVQVKGITNSINVYLGGTAGTIRVGDIPGTMTVKFDPGYTLGKIDQGVSAASTAPWFVNIGSTVLSFASSAGSINGVSLSGNTIAAPASGVVRKVYAYNFQTSATLSNIVANITNGAGTTPTKYTENWLNGNYQGNSVTPPGYLFAIPASTTMAVLLSNAVGPTHYNIYWFNESA